MIMLLGMFACFTSTVEPSATPPPAARPVAAAPTEVAATPAPVEQAEPAPVTPPSVPLSFQCTEAALAGTHPDTLRVYRNEVFARHGRRFTSADLRTIFQASSWYQPDEGFTADRLTDADRACVARIAALAERGQDPGAVQAPDLDGDGEGERVAWDGSTLTIDGVARQLVDPAADPVAERVNTWGEAVGEPPRPAWAGRVEVIDLDVNDRLRELVVVTHPGVSDEWQFTVVRFVDGAIQTLMEPEWLDQSAYRVEPGRLRHEAANCGQSYTLTFTLEDGVLVKRIETKGTFTPGLCAACPYVVRLGPDAVVVGEILRNQRSHADEREDVLPVGRVPPGPLRFRLLELKPETTYLDRLVVRVAGEEIHPTSCGSLCEDDGHYTVIDAGRSLEVRFDLPVGGVAELVADGFYLPYRPTGDGDLLGRVAHPTPL